MKHKFKSGDFVKPVRHDLYGKVVNVAADKDSITVFFPERKGEGIELYYSAGDLELLNSGYSNGLRDSAGHTAVVAAIIFDIVVVLVSGTGLYLTGSLWWLAFLALLGAVSIKTD